MADTKKVKSKVKVPSPMVEDAKVAELWNKLVTIAETHDKT